MSHARKSWPWGCLLLALLAVVLAGAPWQSNAEEDEDFNPYAARKGLSVEQLVQYINKMQRKPKTIRRRPGFIEGIVDACERVLNAKAGNDARKLAAVTLLQVLHQEAVVDDKQADVKLMKWAEKLKDDPVKEIAHAAGLHLWEKRMLARREKKLSPEEATALLTELKAYFAKEKLTNRHLRLASEAIHLINTSITDKDAKNKHFDELGEMFAKSSDRDLARYGRQIAKKPSGGPHPLVGKKLEIVGTTVDGVAFDIDQYKGKVVLVDFWATWCRSCLAQLPFVKETYKKYHEQGLEIVAVSLDKDRETLAQFVQQREISWVNLFDEQNPGFDHPMAKKYGISGIPAMFLLDKNGKVVTADLRGEKMAQAVAKLLDKKVKRKKVKRVN